jgi:hypothetical protein
MLTERRRAEEKVNSFDERDKRERLTGLRLCLKALEPGGGFVLKQHGKIRNAERAVELRRHIAYLEAILPPKRTSALRMASGRYGPCW